MIGCFAFRQEREEERNLRKVCRHIIENFDGDARFPDMGLCVRDKSVADGPFQSALLCGSIMEQIVADAIDGAELRKRAF